MPVLTRRSLAPGRERDYLRYAVFGRQLVEGWLSPLGLTFIDALESSQRQHGVTGHVAEIGVHHGKLFILLSLLGTHLLVEREHGVAAVLYQLLLVIGLIVICLAKGESLSGRRGGK